MNKTDTRIVSFKDINSSVFTLKQGKSYNIAKYCKLGFLGKNKYSFKIINCVSTDTFVVEYYDMLLRDTEYSDFVDTYLSFNNMDKLT
jgi:hypothetical protein